MVLDESVNSSGNISFMINEGGNYFMSINLMIDRMDSKTRYPIVIEVNYSDDVCVSGQYLNMVLWVCGFCSDVLNSTGITSIVGVCDCEV